MNKGGKILVYVLSILAIGATCVAVIGIIISQQERQKRIATENELKTTISAKNELNAQLQETLKAKSRLESDLTRTKQRLEETSSELAVREKAIEDLRAEAEIKNRELDNLNNSITQLMGERDELVKNLTKAEGELSELMNIKETLTKTLEEKETFIQSLREGQKTQQTVDLEKVVIKKEGFQEPQRQELQNEESKDGEGVPASKLSGQILKVNKEFDFIIIDAGQKDGVAVGRTVEIYRDNETLGRAQIEKVYESLSAAAILPDYTKNDIKEGDLVRAL